jgi:hypothetical protein
MVWNSIFWFGVGFVVAAIIEGRRHTKTRVTARLYRDLASIYIASLNRERDRARQLEFELDVVRAEKSVTSIQPPYESGVAEDETLWGV